MAKKTNLRGKEEHKTPKRAVHIVYEDSSYHYRFFDSKVDAIDYAEDEVRKDSNIAGWVEMSAHGFAIEFTRGLLESHSEHYFGSGILPEQAVDEILADDFPEDIRSLLTDDDVDDLIEIMAMMYIDLELAKEDNESDNDETDDDGEDEDDPEDNTKIIDTGGNVIVVHNHGILNIYCNGEE